MPPATRPSDEEVLAYVASNDGAIGYVAARIAVPDGLKILILVD